MYPKGTALLENQNRGVGVRRGPNSQFPHTLKDASGGDIILGSLHNPPKSSPSAKLRANIFLPFDRRTGDIIIKPHFRPIINKLNNMIHGKINDDDDITSEIKSFDDKISLDDQLE